jgi:hypothetical protein
MDPERNHSFGFHLFIQNKIGKKSLVKLFNNNSAQQISFSRICFVSILIVVSMSSFVLSIPSSQVCVAGNSGRSSLQRRPRPLVAGE